MLKRPTITNGATEALNLKRLVLLRNAAIFFELLLLALATLGLEMHLPLLPMLGIILFHGLVNGATWLRLKRRRAISSAQFGLQLALDTLVLTGLLYYAGGYTNPFVSLFLLPLVIAASILPQRHTWFMAALTVGCYTLLMFYYIPLPHMHMNGSGESDFDLHVLGMWFSFLWSAGLIVFFVVRMANSLRERDRALAEIREKALRDEHLVELGTLATGAAHELSTPLATLAVLTGELGHEHDDDPELQELARTMRQQVDRCKEILSNISASTGQRRAEGGGRVAIDHYLRQLVEQWRELRPQARVQLTLKGPTPAPDILADKTLSQAIINILNNAADASIDHVEIEGHWDQSSLTLDIRDRGEGMADLIKRAVGTPFLTTKAGGHGLGLYLAKSVIDRYAGALAFSDRPGGGCQARITLPLTQAGATDHEQ